MVQRQNQFLLLKDTYLKSYSFAFAPEGRKCKRVASFIFCVTISFQNVIIYLFELLSVANRTVETTQLAPASANDYGILYSRSSSQL